MYASLLLVSALSVSVFAAPVALDLSLAPSEDAVSEYFNLLATKVQESKLLSLAKVCDLNKATLPVAPTKPLPVPSAEMKLKHIALGRGTQNYTCDTSKPDDPPKGAGAVATLFDASCVVSTFPDLAKTLGKVAMQFNLTSSESKLNPSNLAVSGRHYFTGPTTPFFDLDVKKLGHANCAKNDSTLAPPDAPKGQKGEPAVPWLKLVTISGATGDLKEVYRVETVGGSAPATCQGMPASFTVQYAAQYWFFESKPKPEGKSKSKK